MSAERGLLDTSVFIARESGRRLDVQRLPERSAVSVVTVAELTAGVLAASTTDLASRRLGTLDHVGTMVALPIDLGVAGQWARLRVLLAQHGRRMAPNDLWIAATAAEHGIPVYSQDDDFAALDAITDVLVVRV